MNMFKQVGQKSIKEYVDSVPEDRRKTVMFLDDLIRRTVPELKPHFASNMLGYGSFKYKNYKGEIIDWPTIALANQKQYISVYVCAVKDGKYIAEQYAKKLGKVSVGKSCIRFKKIEDVDLSVFKKVLKEASKNAGLVGA